VTTAEEMLVIAGGECPYLSSESNLLIFKSEHGVIKAT